MKKLTNKIQMIIRSVFIIFLFYYSFVFQYIPVLVFHLSPSDYSQNMRMASLFTSVSYLILLGIILVVYQKDILQEFQTFLKKWRKNLTTGATCWGIGLLIMMVSNIILITVFHSNGANNDIVIRSMVHAYPLVMGFNVCLLAPFIEEIVYRKSLKDIFGGTPLFIMASFLFFGLAHVMSMATSLVDWLYIIPYGAFGGAFAYAYSKTDTVFTSVLFHMIHNTFVFIMILFL